MLALLKPGRMTYGNRTAVEKQVTAGAPANQPGWMT